MSFEKEMRPIINKLGQDRSALHRTTSQSTSSDYCPEHWDNVIIFGICWRHNQDGTLKSTFTKRV